jgi:hypothetical protein
VNDSTPQRCPRRRRVLGARRTRPRIDGRVVGDRGQMVTGDVSDADDGGGGHEGLLEGSCGDSALAPAGHYRDPIGWDRHRRVVVSRNLPGRPRGTLSSCRDDSRRAVAGTRRDRLPADAPAAAGASAAAPAAAAAAAVPAAVGLRSAVVGPAARLDAAAVLGSARPVRPGTGHALAAWRGDTGSSASGGPVAAGPRVDRGDARGAPRHPLLDPARPSDRPVGRPSGGVLPRRRRYANPSGRRLPARTGRHREWARDETIGILVRSRRSGTGQDVAGVDPLSVGAAAPRP